SPGPLPGGEATLRSPDLFEDLLGVSLGLDLRPDGGDPALRVDHVRHAVDAHVLAAIERLLAPDLVGLQDLLVRVGDQRERQVVLFGELLVRRLAVRGDAEDRDLAPAEGGPSVAQRAGLFRAPGRVVLRVEVEDDRLALEVLERDRAALLIVSLEVRSPVAHLEQFHRAGILSAEGWYSATAWTQARLAGASCLPQTRTKPEPSGPPKLFTQALA